MAEKQTFTVTEKAGAFVAGLRSPGVGNTIELTAEEAEHALILGHIEPAKAVAKAKPLSPVTPAEKD